jgi:hypothetical protein
VCDVAQVKGVERRLQKRGEEIDRLRDEKDQLVSTSCIQKRLEAFSDATGRSLYTAVII